MKVAAAGGDSYSLPGLFVGRLVASAMAALWVMTRGGGRGRPAGGDVRRAVAAVAGRGWPVAGRAGRRCGRRGADGQRPGAGGADRPEGHGPAAGRCLNLTGPARTSWLNAATVLGWLLSSIFVLSLASLARSV
jgi:hypothetical protein